MPYTEFTSQVEKGNVAEVFARGEHLEGTLPSPAPDACQEAGTHQRFTTERPVFAQDHLLAQLKRSGATGSRLTQRSATPTKVGGSACQLWREQREPTIRPQIPGQALK
jgi:hypothetical protein